MCKKLIIFLKLFGKCSGKDIQLHIFKNLYGTKNNSIIKIFFYFNVLFDGSIK